MLDLDPSVNFFLKYQWKHFNVNLFDIFPQKKGNQTFIKQGAKNYMSIKMFLNIFSKYNIGTKLFLIAGTGSGSADDESRYETQVVWADFLYHFSLSTMKNKDFLLLVLFWSKFCACCVFGTSRSIVYLQKHRHFHITLL